MPLLHVELDRRCAAQPNTIAFTCGNDELSYESLSHTSSQLAAKLQEYGVKEGDRVGIFQRKSLTMPIAVYGIFKAGAAYVPLDPRVPKERLHHIIADAGITTLITTEAEKQLLESMDLSTAGITHLVGIDDFPGVTSTGWPEIFDREKMLCLDTLSEDSLAYIMYTSGSTGTPKGLMHTHGSGHAYARLSGELYGLRPGDRMANHSALHFDMSLFEFFAGPLHGATTVLIPEDVMMFPSSLASLIETEKITVWYSVPGALTGLLLKGNIESRDLSALRLVAFAGEPFHPRYLKILMPLCPTATFSNVYGPAEVNQCTHFTFSSAADLDDNAIPIGKVWDDTHALIVDEHDQPTDSGELLIASPTMMQGYWAREDLNEKAFYTAEDGTRYYRTGDLVSTQIDGNMLFLGRRDRQVKSRGYRIELDEIEAALTADQSVEEAAVIARPAEDDSNLIIAIVCGNQMDVRQLRQALAESLPWYAVPHEIVTTDQLPRNATGKIDRMKLSEIYGSAAG